MKKVAIMIAMMGMIAQGAFASPVTEPLAADRYAVARCIPTPSLARQQYPGEGAINSSGSLVRPAGKAEYAAGQLLYVHGRVFDEACVPLRNAKVELWQANADGRYRYAKKEEISNPYPLFAGSGQVMTDNNGAFMFETIIPAALDKQTRYLNLRVSHPIMKKPLTTVLYFASEGQNATDAVYQKMAASVQAKVTKKYVPFEGHKQEGRPMKAGSLLHHDITVKGRDYFRRF